MDSTVWFFNHLSDIGFLYKNLVPQKYKVLKTFLNESLNRYELVGKIPSGKKTLVIKFIDKNRKLVVQKNIWTKFALENSSNFGISETFFNTVKHFQDLGFYILLDKTAEAQIMYQKLAIPFVRKLKEVNIDTSKIAFATNNLYDKGVNYEVWDKSKIKVTYVPFFVYFSHIIAFNHDSKLFNLNEILTKEKTYPFIIPVRKARAERLLLLNSLFVKNILKDSKWSLASYYVNKNIEYSRIQNFVNYYGITSKSFISREIDKTQDQYNSFEEDTYLKNHNKNSFYNEFGGINEMMDGVKLPDFKEWIDSKVHICCETYTSDNYNAGVRPTVNIKSILHITEKIFKPIRTATPFTVLGQKKSLDLLKSYGFKTFDGIINESYDNIELNYEDLRVPPNILSRKNKFRNIDLKLLNKIECIVNESIKLMKYSDKKQIKEITAHNFYLIRNSNFFKKKFKEEVTSELKILF